METKMQKLDAAEVVSFGTMAVRATNDVASQASDSEIAGYCCSSSSSSSCDTDPNCPG